MIPPRIEKLRLTTGARSTRPLPLPMGAREWSADASATAVLLDASRGPLSTVVEVAQQIPDPSTLSSGEQLVVLGVALRGDSLWRRVVRRRFLRMARAPMCGALVARGYVNVGAGPDRATGADVAWGWTP